MRQYYFLYFMSLLLLEKKGELQCRRVKWRKYDGGDLIDREREKRKRKKEERAKKERRSRDVR